MLKLFFLTKTVTVFHRFVKNGYGTEKHHWHRRSKSATTPIQLLISIQKYKTEI